jgi:hypothetical protein
MVRLGGTMSDTVPSVPSTTGPLDEAGGRALVEAWQASGLSGAAFCRQHQLRPQRLHYWRERLGYPIKVVDAARRTTVASSSVVGGFVEMVVSSPPTTDVAIVIGGAVIRVQAGFDPAVLRAVVATLRDAGEASC